MKYKPHVMVLGLTSALETTSSTTTTTFPLIVPATADEFFCLG
jgi:hypothetical protein